MQSTLKQNKKRAYSKLLQLAKELCWKYIVYINVSSSTTLYTHVTLSSSLHEPCYPVSITATANEQFSIRARSVSINEVLLLYICSVTLEPLGWCWQCSWSYSSGHQIALSVLLVSHLLCANCSNTDSSRQNVLRDSYHVANFQSWLCSVYNIYMVRRTT